MRWSWILVGALALLGSAWLMFRAFIVFQIGADWVPYVAHITAGGVVGATVARHAEVKPWREPLAAVIAGFALMTAMLSAMDEAWILTNSVPVIAALVAGAAAAGVGGAYVVRRFAATAPTRAALVVLSAQLLGGLSLVVIVLATKLHLDSKGGIIVMMLFGCILGGFLTQAVTPVRRVWSCGAGGILLVLLVVSGPAGEIAKAVLGGLVFWLLGTLGAVFGWPIARRRATSVEVPAARLQ